jgi:hypothetical protein
MVWALFASVAFAWLAIPPGLMPTIGDGPGDGHDTSERLAALARAQVFVDGGTRRAAAPLSLIECRFLDNAASGTTSKFDCSLEDGARIRVKYGWTPEIHAEVAAAHLVSAVGFGADDMAIARRLRCYGCPRWPMFTRQAADRLHLHKLLQKIIDYDRHADFEWVSIERRSTFIELKFGEEEGWSWNELSTINPALGGAGHAEVDALRLMAMFLNHWDNKPSNQRLACPPDRMTADDPPQCDHPLAMIQDLGSTFGPTKLDLHAWRESPVWADAANCTISMSHLPYHGGTFEDTGISEEGRRLLASRLVRLTRPQVTALFADAGFDQVADWVAAFERRVDAIAHRPPCPRSSAT